MTHAFSIAMSKAELKRGDREPAVSTVRNFLQRFGYIEPAPPAAAPGAVAELDGEVVAALRLYQSFHGLPATGTIDQETITEMERPRCGFPDVSRSTGLAEFSVQGNRWPNRSITYRFDNFTGDLSQAVIALAIRRALEKWSRVTPLIFTRITPPQAADILIRFGAGNHGDPFPFDGVGNVLAHAFFPPPNNGALAGDAHFDDAERWTATLTPPNGGFDLETVALHEFGHSLGLNHSSVANAVMFPTYAGPRRRLRADDIAGIRAIYGPHP